MFGLWIARKQSNIHLLSVSLIFTYLLLQTLTTLDLHSNRIGDKGLVHLADVLTNHKVTNILHSFISLMPITLFTQTLSSLDLSKNSIGVAGTNALASALQYNNVIFIFIINSYSKVSLLTLTVTYIT
jgi:hypothetical protein